jgi:hypothetical protein
MLAMLLFADRGFCIALSELLLRCAKKSHRQHRQHRQRFWATHFFVWIFRENILTLFPILGMF